MRTGQYLSLARPDSHCLHKRARLTQMYAYSQYLFMVPIVVTADFDAKDDYRVDKKSPRRSKWLLRNAVYLRLEAGQALYEAGPGIVSP